MNKSERIDALSWLGNNLLKLPELNTAIRKSGLENPFFTEEFCHLSLNSLANWLQKQTLSDWLIDTKEQTRSAPATVGLIMAGNIPMVGWHDLMCIFGSGNRCRFKLSSQDSVLPLFLLEAMKNEFTACAGYFEKSDQMKGIDALIASGSSASSRQFDYYFKDVPRIIRGSKSSLGFIYGFENSTELAPLTDDIMQYFGMGCRSVTKILVPDGYDFGAFFEALEKYRHLTHHHRYQNNAIYHKAIFLMNGDPFLENDMLVVREHQNIFSPPGVLNFHQYQSMEDAQSIVHSHQQEIQCLVSHKGQYPGSIPFGTAQQPGISDYADGINTLEFLTNLGIE